MLWAALLLSRDSSPQLDDQLRGLAVWSLQFAPRVAIVEESVVVELEASVRLFKGRRALRDRIVHESKDLGVIQVAWGPTSLCALAVARSGKEDGVRRPILEILDPLPFEVLSATKPHHVTLAQLGCRTLGDIRALPRGGISRRFGKELLTALDGAYGLRPEAYDWLDLPETFKARYELPHRVELAPALLYGARRLLLQMCGWLTARHAGTTAFALRWMHDAMRSKSAGQGGELIIRTAEPMRDVEHLCRLLAENLAKIELLAPAGDLELEALDVHTVQERSLSLLPEPGQAGESLALVLERITARLGPEKVLRPQLVDDHRFEYMQAWQTAAEVKARKSAPCPSLPQPTFVLPEPLKLAVRKNRALYQGPLLLLSGPHRVEAGWWHRVLTMDGEHTCTVVRDYFVALSEHAGTLLVFSERLAGDETTWYLQGTFA